MHNKIVAFYRDDEQAGRAHDDLIAAGFSRGSVKRYRGGEEPGVWENIKEAFGFADEEDQRLYREASRRGATALLVDVDEDPATESEAVSILERNRPLDIEREAESWRAGGAEAAAAGAGREPTTGHAGREEERVPIVEERMRVGKRTVASGGVRVHTRVTERPAEEQVSLREEHARVERRPADREVREADRAFQERDIEVRERSEEPVVGKEARVVEEVVVDKDVSERPETVRGRVRGTEVDVERTEPGREGQDPEDIRRERGRRGGHP